VLLYTDGVKEALNASEEEFGLERLSAAFRDTARLGAEAVVKQVQEEVKSFTGSGSQMDDVTIVAIEKR
jgi:sigma-B regulation protein RsbU (phosphoserine phosphatase)